MNVRVMVVDDNAAVRFLMRRMLEATKLASFTFVESADGYDALTKFEPKQFDLCLVDVHMPGGGGVEFVRKARSRPGGRDVRYVMVTGDNRIGTIEAALDDVGADAFLTKPVGFHELVAAVQSLI